MATIYQISGRSWPFAEWIVERWLSLFDFTFLHTNQEAGPQEKPSRVLTTPATFSKTDACQDHWRQAA
jgi:hypothetical protein